MGHIFTSESVTEGHPDKIADLISDKILDEYLKQDPYSRCAVETSAGKGFVHIFGEVTSKGKVDVERVVKDVFSEVGYNSTNLGVDDFTVLNSITAQSPDISAGVNVSLEQRKGSSDKYDTLGAGDQGIVFGYAEDGPNCYPVTKIPTTIGNVNEVTDSSGHSIGEKKTGVETVSVDLSSVDDWAEQISVTLDGFDQDNVVPSEVDIIPGETRTVVITITPESVTHEINPETVVIGAGI